MLIESATIDDLRVACGIKYKGNKQDVFFNTIPENCTSIMMNSNDFPGKQLCYSYVLIDCLENNCKFWSYSKWKIIFFTVKQDMWNQ